MWAYRFLKRKGFAIRNITHTSQKIKQESNLYTEDFFKNIFTTRSILNIYDNLNQIGNMDEIAIDYENIYPTTIAKIGEKSVNVKSFGKDKMRITAVLTILADGTKLPPLLVFRGKTNDLKEKNLQKNYNVSKVNIVVKCQENSWLDHNLFMFWLNNIWFAASTKKSVNNSLLILDRAIKHFDKDLSKEFEKRNAKYILIPSRLTLFHQPLEIVVNKEIKQYMPQADTELRINFGNIKPPS